MTLVIDGHNLIGAIPDIDLADPDDEMRLLQRLRSYRARRGARALEVFFDAGDMPGQANLSSIGIRVHFSAPGQSADDAILSFFRGQRAPGQFAVVTDDHELAGRARAAGASTIPARDFAARLAGRAAPRARRRPGGGAGEAESDPHAPAFADIYARFLTAEKEPSPGRQEPAGPEQAAWLERLYGEDDNLAQQAARWLGLHGGQEALSPLRDALTHASAQVRAAALLALADLGNPAALPDLCTRLAVDRAGLARQAAAQGLGRLARPGDRQAGATLEAAAEGDTKGKVRKAAREALAQIKARRGQGL